MLGVYNHDFMPSEVEQIGVLNRFSELISDGDRDRKATEVPFNAVFDSRHQPGDYVPISVHLITPSQPIRLLADEFRREQAGMGRGLVPVGLLFHRDFTPKLIRLGYRDAEARHHELADFFGLSRSRARPVTEARHPSIAVDPAARSTPERNGGRP
jgi:hypothetical protein